MPKKNNQEKNKTSRKKAVKNTAKIKKENRTRTIKVDVVSNAENNNSNLKPKTKKQAHKRFNSKIQQKKKNNTNKTLKILSLVVLIIGTIVFLLTSPLFNVTEIEIIGNEVVSKEEITSLSQIKLQENTFKIFKTTIKQNIKGNAYIEDVKIKRVLPNKIQITVQERKVRFMVKVLDSYAYINSQGYILDVTNQTKEVPIIEGISTPEEKIIAGSRLNMDDLNSLEIALSILSNCEENEISRFLTNINIENPNEYKIYMAEKAKTIHLGNGLNLGTKILYAKAIIEAEEGNEGDIFVNGDLINGFQPFFRKKM